MIGRFYCHILFFLLFLSSTPVFSQLVISGTVINSSEQNPLPFVHVTAYPGEVSTVTDEDGKFNVSYESEIDSLIFSHVGFEKYILHKPEKDIHHEVVLFPALIQFNEAIVEGFNWNRSPVKAPASIDIIGSAELERYNQVSLVQSVNTMPGVRMEERSPGSYRFSIRGSLLRSPFGVRNVKIYWNGIPFTDAGGNTHLNLIDMNSIGKVEVIKGPSASMYGAGTGGVVMLQSNKAEINKDAMTMRGVSGSFGLLQGFLQAATATDQSAYTISYAHQKRSGYRDHSEVNRKMLTFGSRHYAGKNTLFVNGFYSDHFYEIPGGIDLEAFNTKPTSARPGSESQNSSIRNKTLLIGIGNEWSIGRQLRNITHVYGSFTDFDHPFILDYKRNSEQSLGGRSTLSYRLRLFDFPSEVSAGGEYQQHFVMAKNYENFGGIRGALLLDDEITSKQYFGFLQLNMDMTSEIFFSAGVSINNWNYRFVRVSDAPLKEDYTQYRAFRPVVSPRLALLKSLSGSHSVYGNVSWGFSPPSVAEIRTSEGSLNTDLEAEQGINYEAGIKGIFSKTLDYNITLFSMRLNNTIVSRTSETGVVLFSNSGSTMQNGLELATGLDVNNNPNLFLSVFKVWTSYAYSHFRFRNYRQNDNDFSGNELTGVPANVFVSGLDFRFKPGLYMHFTWNYTDKIPLNDANTVYSNRYHLLTGRVGLKRTLFNNHLLADIFTGIDNLLDEKYSHGNDLNAFGGRYYQPAPGRNYYAGISLTVQNNR